MTLLFEAERTAVGESALFLQVPCPCACARVSAHMAGAGACLGSHGWAGRGFERCGRRESADTDSRALWTRLEASGSLWNFLGEAVAFWSLPLCVKGGFE